MANKVLEFYFDVGSPTTYLAWTQVAALAEATGAEIAYKPMLLGGVFKATGNTSPAMVPAKGVYMLTDLERFARRYRVDFRYNPYFPINTLPLMRALTGVQLRTPEKFEDFLRLIFEGMWKEALNVNDPTILATLLTKGGYSPDNILTLAEDPEVKEKLKATTDEAIKRGVFGAPTFFVRGQMYFGQDRLDFVKEALKAF